MHKPDPALPADQQDKRSVIAIELPDVDRWLAGTTEDARALLRAPAPEVLESEPQTPPSARTLEMHPSAPSPERPGAPTTGTLFDPT